MKPASQPYICMCLSFQPASALASTDGHFTGSDFEPRSYLGGRSSLLKVPTMKHHANPNLSAPFAGQESSRCASAAGGYANPPFSNPHTRHASGSAAYLRAHLMVVPPDGGPEGNNGGGSGSYLSDSDLQQTSHHIGSVSSSPGLRTKSISPTTSAHDALFAHSRPQHQMLPHIQTPAPPPPPPPPDIIFCPSNTTSATAAAAAAAAANDFFSPMKSDTEAPLQLRKSPTVNYATSGSDSGVGATLWDGGRLSSDQPSTRGSVLTPVMDDYPQHQQHPTSSSPMYFPMRDSVNDTGGTSSSGLDATSGQTCGGGAGESFQSRSGSAIYLTKLS